MSDGARPHRYPLPPDAPHEAVIAWQCGACGHWVREVGPADRTRCPVDWRNDR